MPSLILIKHSLPVIDPHRPAAQWELSAEGVRRCDGLAEQLLPFLPARLVSSPESKAQATAERLGQHFGLDNLVVDGLEEHHRRTAPHLAGPDFERAIECFFRSPAERVFGEETADAAAARFGAALDDLLTRWPADNLMVVTHGTVIALTISRRAGCDALTLWRRLGLPSFVVLDRDTFEVRAEAYRMDGVALEL